MLKNKADDKYRFSKNKKKEVLHDIYIYHKIGPIDIQQMNNLKIYVKQ